MLLYCIPANHPAISEVLSKRVNKKNGESMPITVFTHAIAYDFVLGVHTAILAGEGTCCLAIYIIMPYLCNIYNP